MSDIDALIKVLIKIADNFNRQKISWALGGSLLLYFHGITDQVHDIDIMIDSSDVNKAQVIMDELASRIETEKNPRYKTAYYLNYTIEDIKIDIMADFAVVSDKEYHFPLKKSAIDYTLIFEDTTVPLHSLKEWLKYYKLMNRPDKVALIEKHLKK